VDKADAAQRVDGVLELPGAHFSRFSGRFRTELQNKFVAVCLPV